MAKKSTQAKKSSRVIRSAKRQRVAKPISAKAEPPKPTVYERTLNGITPLLKGKEIASLSPARVTALAKSADLHVVDVRTLVAAHKMAGKVPLPPEVLFALGKNGTVPGIADLAKLAPAEIKKQLQSAAKASVISPSMVESFNNLKSAIEQLQLNHAPLTTIADQLKLKMSPALIKTLAAKRINTLADIQRAGGLANLDGVNTEDLTLKTLDAQANLSLVSSDLQLNAGLIRRGFSHGLDIADETPQRFAARTEGLLDPVLSARIHTVASVQARLLANVITARKIDAQFGVGASDKSPLDKTLPSLCGCDDCHDATSPLAYLADLLNYALSHVRFNSNTVTLTDLEGRFYQPVRNLPTDCDALQASIRQVRICCEVLRGYLKAQMIAYTTPTWYLQEAYARLLEANGTSFDEVRLIASSQNAISQNDFMDRLMIPPDLQLFDEFIRDPSPSATAQRALTERWLDEFFGLRDTGRDPLDPGVTPELLVARQQELRRRWKNQESGLAYLFWISPKLCRRFE